VPRAAASVAAALDRNVKCSSITIRLSKAECDQLRERAAEAGLTVSAYLRSCTLEVESLRAQVKEALAELRSAGSKAVSTAVPLPRRSLLQRLPQVFPAWRNGRSGAQA
jgi:hypothetical protein